jgi:hypothetical protein
MNKLCLTEKLLFSLKKKKNLHKILIVFFKKVFICIEIDEKLNENFNEQANERKKKWLRYYYNFE